MELAEREIRKLNTVLESYKKQVSDMVGQIIFLQAEVTTLNEELQIHKDLNDTSRESEPDSVDDYVNDYAPPMTV